jgi:hypothetical protein
MSNEMKQNHPMIDIELKDNTLTEEQKQILHMIYQKTKQTTESILRSQQDATLKITQVIGQIIKIIEYVKINDKKMVGSSKKAVALELGRMLIQECVQEEDIKQNMLTVYNMIAEQTLEVLVDVSHVVNTRIQEKTASCLDWLCGKKN